jgi:dTDP-4-dehydrorhamnose 3,5-epimerase-like enzyme
MKKIKLRKFGSIDSYLVPIEKNIELDFDVERVFYVIDTKDSIRGNHANRETKMLCVCLAGEVMIEIFDGHKISHINLSSSDAEGVIIDKMIWRRITGLTSYKLLFLCDKVYNPNEYILKIEDFKNLFI